VWWYWNYSDHCTSISLLSVPMKGFKKSANFMELLWSFETLRFTFYGSPCRSISTLGRLSIWWAGSSRHCRSRSLVSAAISSRFVVWHAQTMLPLFIIHFPCPTISFPSARSSKKASSARAAGSQSYDWATVARGYYRNVRACRQNIEIWHIASACFAIHDTPLSAIRQ